MRLVIEPADLFYDETADQAAHVPQVQDMLRAAGFTATEQAEFLRAWDATEETLTPQWRFLLDRYEAFVYPNRGVRDG